MEPLLSSPRKRMRLECGVAHIYDLDNASLQHIFSYLTPLPDLFNVARTCKRFRDAATARKNWLLVEHGAGTSFRIGPNGREGEYQKRFICLRDAVEHSRPGDTILLAPGAQCHFANGIVINHCLRIMGGGKVPEECVVRLSSALTFKASGHVSNISIYGDIGGCIAHTSGRLTVEDCILHCNARGLYHLASPIEFLAKESLPCSSSSPVARLLVAATSCAGGSSAVRISEDGRLLNVRVVYEKSKFLFWFEVTSASINQRRGHLCSEGGIDMQPSWAAKAGERVVKFNIDALKHKAKALKAMATP